MNRFDDRAIDDRALPSPVAHPGRFAVAGAAALAAAAVTWRLSRR